MRQATADGSRDSSNTVAGERRTSEAAERVITSAAHAAQLWRKSCIRVRDELITPRAVRVDVAAEHEQRRDRLAQMQRTAQLSSFRNSFAMSRGLTVVPALNLPASRPRLSISQIDAVCALFGSPAI